MTSAPTPVCLDWVQRRDLDRAQIHERLLGTLLGALMAAGVTPPTAGAA